jgi:hypothetical protein
MLPPPSHLEPARVVLGLLSVSRPIRRCRAGVVEKASSPWASQSRQIARILRHWVVFSTSVLSDSSTTERLLLAVMAVASRHPCANVTRSARGVAQPRRGKGPSYRLLLLECGTPPSPSSVRSAAFGELAAVDAASDERLRRFGGLTDVFGHVSRACLHLRAASPAISRSLCRGSRLKLCCGLLLCLCRFSNCHFGARSVPFCCCFTSGASCASVSSRILSIDARRRRVLGHLRSLRARKPCLFFASLFGSPPFLAAANMRSLCFMPLLRSSSRLWDLPRFT